MAQRSRREPGGPRRLVPRALPIRCARRRVPRLHGHARRDDRGDGAGARRLRRIPPPIPRAVAARRTACLIRREVDTRPHDAPRDGSRAAIRLAVPECRCGAVPRRPRSAPAALRPSWERRRRPPHSSGARPSGAPRIARGDRIVRWSGARRAPPAGARCAPPVVTRRVTIRQSRRRDLRGARAPGVPPGRRGRFARGDCALRGRLALRARGSRRPGVA